MNNLCKYGTHRVISPVGTLPQTADKINNEMVCQDNEILVDVDTLNIDSASFTQIKNACGNDIEKMKEMVENIVNSKGKMQNPVTGSGNRIISFSIFNTFKNRKNTWCGSIKRSSKYCWPSNLV